jgi:hypothetical protein
MANQGQKLISSWIQECHKQRGAVVYIGWVVERIREEIRDLRVYAYVRAVTRQSRVGGMAIIDELTVELKKWEELPAVMEQAERELHLERMRRAA